MAFAPAGQSGSRAAEVDRLTKELYARFLRSTGSSRSAGSAEASALRRLDAVVPLSVQASPLAVQALAEVGTAEDIGTWLSLVLAADVSLLPPSLPPPILRVPGVVDMLLTSPSVRAQVQGLTALVALQGDECRARVEALVASASSPLVAQHGRDVLAASERAFDLFS